MIDYGSLRTSSSDSIPSNVPQNDSGKNAAQTTLPVDKDIFDDQSSRRYPLDHEISQPVNYVCDNSHNMFDSSDLIEPDKFSKISIDYCYKVGCIPKSYTDAMNYVDADSWQSAMSEEIDSLKINNTFNLVVAPRDANIMKSRWVFSVKKDKNNMDTLKVRVCCKEVFPAKRYRLF